MTTPILHRALGADLALVHPKLRARFGVGLAAGTACVGTGVMTRIWHGTPLIRPLLHLGASRHILFPEQGTDVPFTMENWPYLDRAGRETISFTRTFELPTRRRRFDATMVWDGHTGRLVDYLGTHQHVAADLTLTADATGGVWIRSTRQRFRLSRVDCRLPAAITGAARVHEWYDARDGMFHIDVRVVNPWLGPLFGYRGTFTVQYVDLSRAPAPASVKPAREEVRI